MTSSIQVSSAARMAHFSALMTLCCVSSALTTGRLDKINVSNACRLMSPGINIGNTLESIPAETSWGNPPPNEAYFRGVKTAGFRSIRSPIAWTQYADGDDLIGADWMGHVTDVVRMALRAHLYVMINVHWDGGWIQPTYAKQNAVTLKLRRFWSQIATNFKDFDSHLLFAGTNEIGVEGVYGPPTPENAKVQNGFNQAFVESVRSSGGENATRMLVVQGYNTDIDATVMVNTNMPADSVQNRIMMEVHYYSPYNFVLNDKSDVWQWGRTATDPKATDTWGNEDYVDGEFSKMKAAFIDKGVPVILGEYSAGMKARFPGMDLFRKLWDEYVTRSASRHGMIPMFWDTGQLLDRRNGKPNDSDLASRLVLAAGKNADVKSRREDLCAAGVGRCRQLRSERQQ
jgi:endoglucanase